MKIALNKSEREKNVVFAAFWWWKKDYKHRHSKVNLILRLLCAKKEGEEKRGKTPCRVEIYAALKGTFSNSAFESLFSILVLYFFSLFFFFQIPTNTAQSELHKEVWVRQSVSTHCNCIKAKKSLHENEKKEEIKCMSFRYQNLWASERIYFYHFDCMCIRWTCTEWENYVSYQFVMKYNSQSREFINQYTYTCAIYLLLKSLTILIVNYEINHQFQFSLNWHARSHIID